MSDLTVPRRVERILASLGASAELRQDVLGDLQEEFSIRAAWDSPETARRWYYRESLRVAPHLLRDWWGALGWRDVFRLTVIIFWSAVAIVALQSIGNAFVYKLAGAVGVPLPQLVESQATRLQVLFAANAVVSVAIGYFAAWLAPRARIPSALTTASFWGAFMSIAWFSFPGIAPTWFSAINLLMVVASIALGGVLRASSVVIPSAARNLLPRP